MPLEQIDDDTIALTLESGLLGTIYFMQASFPYLKRQGGSIINLGSREGVFGGQGFGIYAATKEGIRGLSRVAAREWGKYGIRVNVINPAALTEAARAFFAAHPEQEQAYLSVIALGRLGDPQQDIGPLAVFLAGAEAGYVTGQTINADGGQMMLLGRISLSVARMNGVSTGASWQAPASALLPAMAYSHSSRASLCSRCRRAWAGRAAHNRSRRA